MNADDAGSDDRCIVLRLGVDMSPVDTREDGGRVGPEIEARLVGDFFEAAKRQRMAGAVAKKEPVKDALMRGITVVDEEIERALFDR